MNVEFCQVLFFYINWSDSVIQLICCVTLSCVCCIFECQIYIPFEHGVWFIPCASKLNLLVLYWAFWVFLVAQMVKNLPAVWVTWVQSLGLEDRLKKGMATHSSILVWRTPWTEEPCGLYGPWVAKRQDRATKHSTVHIEHFRPIVMRNINSGSFLFYSYFSGFCVRIMLASWNGFGSVSPSWYFERSWEGLVLFFKCLVKFINEDLYLVLGYLWFLINFPY